MLFGCHTVCRKQCNLWCILILKLIIFHHWAEKKVQHKIQWTWRRHTVLQIGYTGSQPPLCAGFWLFRHFADQLFDSDVVYCFSCEMNLTEIFWLNWELTTEYCRPGLFSFTYLFCMYIQLENTWAYILFFSSFIFQAWI